jgi:hypothetical protein
MRKASFGKTRLSMSTVNRYNQIAQESELERVGFNEMSDMDNMAYANGRQAAQSTEPYILQIANAGVGQETAIIFGRNRFGGVANFGSGANITINMGVATVPYEQLLQQSASEPFEVVKMRLSSTSLPQLDNTITYVWTDSTGESRQKPITVTSYLSPDQNQNNLRDIDYRLQIDGSTHFEYPIEAGAAVSMSIYISAKINTAKPLVGQGAVTEYAKARIRSFSK